MKDTKRLKGRRILIIDDDPVCRAVYRLAVEHCVSDALILEVADGVEAIAEMTKVTPDLILADLALPGIDGRRVIRELKASRAGYDVPVLALSSVALSATDIHPLLSGVFPVSKPVVREDLEQMILQCLTKKRVLPDFAPAEHETERYADFDIDAMEASVGCDHQTQLVVLGIFMDNVERRRRLLEEIRTRSISFHEARVNAHGILGSARVVGAPRLSRRLAALVHSLAEDDQMMVTLCAQESIEELERVALRMQAYIDRLTRNVSIEIIERFRIRQRDMGGPQ